jgi:hypothetical protein
MKWRTASLRQEVYRILTKEVQVIKVRKVARDCMASSTKPKDFILLSVDTLQMSLLDAVIHELLHWILDPLWEGKVAYDEYEEWVIGSTERIRTSIGELGHEERWRKAIERKIKG